MSNFIENARALVFLALGAICLALSFKGFPFALVSLLGSLIVMTACTRGVQAILYKDKDPLQNASRPVTVALSVALAVLGFTVVKWGKLASINIGPLAIGLDFIGVVVGIAGGLAKLDND